MQNKNLKNLWGIAVAYFGGSFILIQIANIGFPYFEVEQYIGLNTDQIMKGLFIGLPIGLPVVLISFYFFKRNNLLENNDSTADTSIYKNGAYRQKIAVVPFTNLNKDEDGAFLVDGIVEDIITEFSMIKEIEILSRQSCFDFRDKNYSIENFRNEFDLDYIVSGSIRVVGDRLRISVELSEISDGNVIWASKYDRVKEDIFDIQDEIVRKITIALLGGIEISSLKRAHRKPSESITSYEFLLKGKDNHHKFTKEANAEAMINLDLAISTDKNNAQAYAWKACVIGQALGRGYCEMTDEKVSELLQLLDKALEVDPNDFECHRMQAEVYLSMHDFEKAKISGQKATSMNPNDPRVISVYGEALLRVNEIDKGLEYLEKAYELDPIPQGQTTGDRRLAALFYGYYLKNDFEKCQLINNDVVNIDPKTWLLNYHLHQINNNDCTKDNWFISGKREFENLDWKMEIDRFHLNDDILNKNLLAAVETI